MVHVGQEELAVGGIGVEHRVDAAAGGRDARAVGGLVQEEVQAVGAQQAGDGGVVPTVAAIAAAGADQRLWPGRAAQRAGEMGDEVSAPLGQEALEVIGPALRERIMERPDAA